MSDSFERELAVFNAARRLPEEQRAEYLEQTCAGDPEMRRRVEELLQAGEQAGGFLQEPAPGAQRPADFAASGSLPTEFATPVEKPGERIGRYKLLQQIGEGGCGVVYMAEQEEPVRRRVALKIIKLGMDTKNVIARFEAERQALALMDHPNIAKVLDAGATDAGRPFFVMELVRGIKITDYCDENNLSTEERLKLFIQVCQAVQHAHQKGIIHRDIKPSNILVADHDGVAVPKIIDFGIAKATSDQRLTDKTLFTAFEQFIGTPAYMSPEQAKLSGLDIDTRTDIYSLGVLLYELLTGKTPLNQRELLAAGPEEMRRTIREKEPLRPSTRLTQELALKTESRKQKVELDLASSARLLQLKELIHVMRGDLDWIVMKALEKDRARRYETATGLASDVQRYLSGEAIVARPPSKLYRLQKLARRNKLAFAAAGAVAAALMSGLVVSCFLLVKERQSRQRAVAAENRAVAEAVKSRQFANLLKNSFKSVGPSVAKGRDTTMLREILDETGRTMGGGVTNLPEVEAEMCLTLADTYYDLGSYTQMVAMARRSLEVARTRLGETNEAVADSLISLGYGLLNIGRERLGEMHYRDLAKADIERRLHESTLEEAEKYCREALAMSTQLLGRESLQAARALDLLACISLTQSKAVQAESLCRQALAIYQKLPATEDATVARLMARLALTLVYEGDSRLAEAEDWIERAIAMQRKLFGDNHPDIAQSLFTLASIQHIQGKLTEAEATFGETAKMWRTLQGDDRVEMADTLNNLALLLRREGNYPEAEAKQREALLLQRKVFGNKHKDVAIALLQLGIILDRRGQPAEAETSFRQALDIWRELQTKDLPEFADTLYDLGLMLMQRRMLAEAETNFTEAVAMRRRLLGNEHPDLGYSLHHLAIALDRQGKVDEAVMVSREALAIHSRVHTNDCIEVADEFNNLGFFLSQREELAEAESMLRGAVAMRRNVLGAVHGEVARSLNNLANVLRMEGKLADAETAFRENLALEQKLGNQEIVMARLVDLADVFTKEGKTAEAESLLNQVLSREPHVVVAGGLIGQASILKGERQRDCTERANCLLRCACEILQKLPVQELTELSPWAILWLEDGGFKQQATNLCWRVLDSTATSAAWFNGVAWLLATTENASSREPALAVELAKRSLELDPKRNDWNTLGIARYRAGDFKQALTDLEKSAQLDHDLTSFNSFFMAMAHFQLGDAEAARRLYAQGVEWMEKKAPQSPELPPFRAEAEQLLDIVVKPRMNTNAHE